VKTSNWNYLKNFRALLGSLEGSGMNYLPWWQI